MNFDRPILSDPWEKLSQVAVLGAEYDSPERQPHPRLLEGSWVDLNNCILELLDNQTKNQLIWLHGATGVGTSAISFNVAERMKSLKINAVTRVEMRSAGTFFFSRGHAKRSTTGYFFATLAYQLARNFPSVQKVVNEAIHNHPALLDPGASLRDQMEALFLRPLRALQLKLRECPPIVFIVDALHECTSKHEVADLISLLCQVLRRPDMPRIHIQLTSGSQAHIREAFQKEEMRPLLCEIRAGSSGELLAINMASRDACIPGDLPHILDINTTTYNACINGDLPAAEGLLTQEINTDINSHRAYANRAFVMARKYDWDHALEDALKSVSIQPSLTGYIAKGIALCGGKRLQDAMRAFELASVFTSSDSKTSLFVLLIKTIAFFNANQHEDAILHVQELAAVCPNTDTLACRIVEAYLCLQQGTSALDGGRHDEAADHFGAAVKAIAFRSQSAVHSEYQDFVVLFGWDLESLWKTANQKQCDALLHAGRLGEAVESHRYMMDMSDEATKASCLDWSTAFVQECNALYAANGVADFAASGDAAFAEHDYDKAIELYSAAIELDSATDSIFANRSKVRLVKMLWDDALLDAEKVIELNPSSYLGYELKHAALHGAQSYDDAIEAFQIMLLKLDDAPDPQLRKLHQHYISPFDAECAIRDVIHAHLDNAPIRLINTSTGRLCDREAQIHAFKTSTEYRELLASIIKNADLELEHIQDVVVAYFRWVMLSHRWEEKELLLHDIQDKIVYELDPVDSIMKLQSFCEIVRDSGFLWAWIDTCCIDQKNNVELQKSVNSMFVWYHNSALTIVYLSDVPPSSKSRTLANSAWNRRGWTVQEFLAPKVVLFYRKDWSLYLDDQSANHKKSVAIMRELGDATGIDSQSLVAFHPGMRNPREKLQWASTRVTTFQEDIAYSLFGIFGVHLPVIYGEKKQNALGRLLQEIVAHSGDVSALDWVGQASAFNSCLPADITSYQAPPSFPSLSDDGIRSSISSLRDIVIVEVALELYRELDSLSAARFAHCRLHLPCIAFPVTEVRQRPGQDHDTHFTYQVNAKGLHNLLITTEDKLIQFWPERPTLQTFYLVCPWNRDLLELPDFVDQDGYAEPPHSPDGSQSMEDYWTPPGSPPHDTPTVPPGEKGTVDSKAHSRALRLIVRLGQPFGALFLAQQRGGEYKRIASDHAIIVQVRDITSIRDTMDIRSLEIL